MAARSAGRQDARQLGLGAGSPRRVRRRTGAPRPRGTAPRDPTGVGVEPVAQAAGLAAAPAVAAAPRGHARQQTGARVAVAERAVDEGLEARGRAARARRSRRATARGPGWRARSRGRRGVRAGRSSACRAACWRAARAPGTPGARGRAKPRSATIRASRPARRAPPGRRAPRSSSSSLSRTLRARCTRAPKQVGAVDRGEQRLGREVGGEGARAPGVEAQVDGVGAGRQGRLQGRRPPGRRQQLGARPGRRPVRAMAARAAQSASSFHSASRRTRMRPEVGTISTPLPLELVHQQVDAHRVARDVAGDHHVDVVLFGDLAQVGAHVHADDRAHAVVGELLHDRHRALGAAGHVDPDLAGALAGLLFEHVRPGSLGGRAAILGHVEQGAPHVVDQQRLALGEKAREDRP